MKRTLSLALVGAFVLVAGCDTENPPAEASVRVMSQNLYLGGDLFTLLDPSCNGVAILGCVAQLYATIEASDPEARMAAIAAEIASVEPDLVGLQEVSTYYTQTPADNLPNGAATPATNKTYDFLELLLDALEDEGLTYTVASRSDNSDVEFPATADGSTFFDVRYQDADVILAKQGVSTSDAEEVVYNSLLTIDVGGTPQTFTRSYQSVMATVDGLDFRFVNTHLEVGGQASIIQQGQGSQLVSAISATGGPLVLVGDLNSDAAGTGTTTYALVTDTSTGLVDAAGSGAGDATCCQDADLRNDASDLSTRIDLILVRNGTVTGFDTILDADADMVDGLWPSDHAGVWADLTLTNVES